MTLWKKLVALFSDLAPEAKDPLAAVTILRNHAESLVLRRAQASQVESLSDSLGALAPSARRTLATRLWSELIGCTDDPESWVRAVALKGLGQVAQIARHDLSPPLVLSIIPMACRLTGDSDVPTRVAASQLLSALADLVDEGSKRSMAVTLGPLTRDAVDEVRAAAIRSLSSLGDAASPFLPQAFAWLSDASSEVRESGAAFVSVVRLEGPIDAPVQTRLLEMLSQDPSPRVRETVADALGRRCEGTPSVVVRALITALTDPQESVRHKAIFALGELGPDAEPAVPHLARLLGDAQHREAAGFGLRGIGTPSAEQTLRSRGNSG